MKKTYQDYLDDMLAAIAAIENFFDMQDQHGFVNDLKTVYAVIRAFEVLGEAAKNMPQSIRDQFPTIPWSYLIGMRNKLIHEYAGVDTQVLWETIQHDLPPLKKCLK